MKKQSQNLFPPQQQSQKIQPQPQPPKPDTQKKVVQQIAQINILKQQMVQQAQKFVQQLDELQILLGKKSNELDILADKKIGEITEKNIGLVEEFIKYQQDLIGALETKEADWQGLENQLYKVEAKLREVLQKPGLVTKLAQIQVMENQIESLTSEIEKLQQEKKQKRRN